MTDDEQQPLYPPRVGIPFKVFERRPVAELIEQGADGDYRVVGVQELIDRIAEAVVTKLAATQRYPVIEEEGGLVTDA